MKKKVLLFDCSCFKYMQGTTSVMLGIIENIQESNKKINVFEKIEIHVAYNELHESIKIRKKDIFFHKISSNVIMRNIYSLTTLSHKIKSDYIISNYTIPIPFLSRGKKICFLHDLLFLKNPEFFSFKYKLSRVFLFYFSAKFCDHLLTISNFSKSCIEKIYKIKGDKISVFKLGVDNSYIKKSNPEINGKYNLLYVANYEKRKRHNYALRVFEELKRSKVNVKLNIIGGGTTNYAKEMFKIMKKYKYKYQKDFDFFTNISNEELSEIYKTTHIFLFPSYAEGFGIPVLEAALMGIPCVVSDGSSLDELVDFYIGYKFKRDSYNSFSKKCKLIIKNYSKFKKLAIQNIPIIKEKISWKYRTTIFLKIIKDII